MGAKPAGVTCKWLCDDRKCKLWGRPERPDICKAFKPSPDICGSSFEEAMRLISEMERLTSE
jgi:hypothetical protein